VLYFEYDCATAEPDVVWSAGCSVEFLELRGAQFSMECKRLMAKKAKPVKRGKKLRAAKKLEKKTTLSRFDVLTPRLPVGP
jgi:hypothetical protein